MPGAAASCCASACSSRRTASRCSRWPAARAGASRSTPGAADGFFPSIHADDAAHRSGRRARRADRHLRRRRRRAAPPGRPARRAGRGGRAGAGCSGCRAPKAVVGPLGDSQRVSNRRFRDGDVVVAARSRALREAWPRDRPGGGHRAGAVRVGCACCCGSWRSGTSASGSRPCSRRARSTTTSRSVGVGSRWTVAYNEHLVRDVGSLNLALVVLVLAALFVVDPHARARRGGRVARQRGPALRVPPRGTSTWPAWRAPTSSGIAASRWAAPIVLLVARCCALAWPRAADAYRYDVKVAGRPARHRVGRPRRQLRRGSRR